MKPKPVSRTGKPRYPTREAVLADPRLLERHLPPGWRVTRELAATTSLFVAAGLAACGGESRAQDEKVKKPAVALVAPIFEHGEGRGATGCVVVSPPVFLSEEEALQVIREALKAHGINFSERNVRVQGVTFPERERTWRRGADGRSAEVIEETGRRHPFDLDLRDPKRGISVEFVSKNDYRALGGPHSMSTVQSYDTKEAAGYLKKEMKKTRKGGRYFGAFYDPLKSESKWDAKAKRWKRSTEESKKLLKKQVADFVNWLKAQGAI